MRFKALNLNVSSWAKKSSKTQSTPSTKLELQLEALFASNAGIFRSEVTKSGKKCFKLDKWKFT